MDLLNNKIKTIFQFAYCSRKIFFGETVLIKMMSNKVKLIVLATDVSSSQESKYLSKADYYGVKVIRYLTKSELASIFNKNEVACVGLSDDNMARQIVKLIE